MGDVVLGELLKARGKMPSFGSGVDYYCLIEDEELRPASLELTHFLRGLGFCVECSLGLLKPDKQFKRALEMKARFTVKMERGPAGEPIAKVKDLATPRGEDHRHAKRKLRMEVTRGRVRLP